MWPRFSIRAIFLAISYIAVDVAAFVYLVVVSVDDHALIDREKYVLPHHLVHLFFDLHTTGAVWAAWEDVDVAWHRAVLAVTSLGFGFLCGLLALWRYRVLERRAKEPPK